MLIALEGGDGVGKSTQHRLLVAHLQAAGHEVVATRQPGGTALGTKIREMVLDPASGDIPPRAEALLYAADKADHVASVIEPALARGAIVVTDRYVDSMLAYQGLGRALALDELRELARWAVAGRYPDLTVLLDMDPADAVGVKQQHDRLEAAGAEFHRRVRQSFVALAEEEPHRYVVLPAREPVDVLATAIAARVDELLVQVEQRTPNPVPDAERTTADSSEVAAPKTAREVKLATAMKELSEKFGRLQP